jgi:phosphatidylethanolamine/phosphatidyl-N-methylethanolamine N-methyltransferase
MSSVPPLSQIQMDFYDNYYSTLANEGNIGGYHRHTHKIMEKKFKPSDCFPITLEIGAGSGEHFEFVNHGFDTYYQSDIRENQLQSEDKRIIHLVCDAVDVPLEDSSCDRVLVTCLLHHLADPMEALIEMRRLVKLGGIVTILIPSDPGLLFRFLRRISSERKLKKMGFTFGKLLHAVEHRNHVQSLREQVEFVFARDEVTLKSWPIPLKRAWNLNLLYIYNIKKSEL